MNLWDDGTEKRKTGIIQWEKEGAQRKTGVKLWDDGTEKRKTGVS